MALMVACATAIGPATALADDAVILLRCQVQGQMYQSSSDDVTRYDRDRHRYETRSESHLAEVPINTAVMVELTPSQGAYSGRIHLPSNMVPPLHSGGSDGWWSLRDVTANGDVITGQYKLNGLNEPKLRLNRRTGEISLKDLHTFSGTCERSSNQNLF